MIMSNTTPRTHHRISFNETRGLLGFLIWAWLPRCKIFEPKNVSLSWGATSSHLLCGDWVPWEAHGCLSLFVTVWRTLPDTPGEENKPDPRHRTENQVRPPHPPATFPVAGGAFSVPGLWQKERGHS